MHTEVYKGEACEGEDVASAKCLDGHLAEHLLEWNVHILVRDASSSDGLWDMVVL